MSGSVAGQYTELRKLPNTASNCDSNFVDSSSERDPIRMTLESIAVKKLRISNVYIREFLAEFLGTFILIIFGVGANAQTTLGQGKTGHILSSIVGWSFGVTFGVLISAPITGGHLNPAITLAMTVLGRLPVRKFPIFCLGQYLGALAASACVYGIYHDALDVYDGGVRQVTGPNATAGIWATYPQEFLSIWSGLADQVFGTTMLVLCVMTITDPKNNFAVPNPFLPLTVGMLIIVLSQSLGFNCGCAINPARDFSPRAFTAMAGWGSATFSAYNYWFWVPIVGPHIGAICGAFFYLLMVGIHLPEPANEVMVCNDEKKKNELQGNPDIKSTDHPKNRLDDSAWA